MTPLPKKVQYFLKKKPETGIFSMVAAVLLRLLETGSLEQPLQARFLAQKSYLKPVLPLERGIKPFLQAYQGLLDGLIVDCSSLRRRMLWRILALIIVSPTRNPCFPYKAPESLFDRI
jgi:hypothetical protein